MKFKTIGVLLLFISSIGVSVLIHGTYFQNKLNDEVIYLINKLPMNEDLEKSEYHKMMIKILTTYSYQYDPKFRKSMSKDQKIEYIRLNYRVAKMLKFGLYDVPVVHQLESSFNPYLDHDYGETGIGGIKWGTALLAHKLLNFMPENYRRVLYFNIKRKEDLKCPLISLKVGYILLWWERINFDGREDWYVSIYHWGGFLSRYYDNGRGKIPVSFKINGIKYNAIKYYVSFAEIRDAYEQGLLEPSKPIEEKYRRWLRKMKKEELDYRRMRKIIKRQRKSLLEKREIEQALDKKYEDIEKQLKKTDKELKKIGGMANKKGWSKQYGKLKKLVKDYIGGKK